MRTILVTGGHGFIGSNFILYWLNRYPDDQIINIDAGTYAARPEFLRRMIPEESRARYRQIKADIRNRDHIREIFKATKPDHIFHFAAESHVCNSIRGPEDFMTTNFMGTFNLLEEARLLWNITRPEPGCDPSPDHVFHHISTDEVFGELGPIGLFNETLPLKPRSPYSGSKAASDLLVNVYFETYGLNTRITNCTNNYGPNQHEEKLIPGTFQRLMRGEPALVHGKGNHVRDWLFVMDHCTAIDTVFTKGYPGEKYCVGSGLELQNIEVIQIIHSVMLSMGVTPNAPLEYVMSDARPTDDYRYAVNTDKLRELGWKPTCEDKHGFATALRFTFQEMMRESGVEALDARRASEVNCGN